MLYSSPNFEPVSFFMSVSNSCFLTYIQVSQETGNILFYNFLLSLQSMLLKYLELMGRRQWHPTPVLLPGKSHGRRSLVGSTERLHFHFSLLCIGEGNGNPLQCSCLENPRDGGAWWAAIYGLAQSWTRLKWLSLAAWKSYEWLPLYVFVYVSIIS